MKSLILTLCLFCIVAGRAEASVDLAIIQHIESNGNVYAYNKASEARGLYQITPICLKEYNNYHKDATISLKGLYEPIQAYKVAYWYLNIRIPQLLKHYHKEVNLNNILIAYNAGIRAVIKGYMPKETRDYIRKYNKEAIK